jgi:methylglutaconyl-CoA hydratase
MPCCTIQDDGNVVYLTLDSPPNNAVDDATMEEFPAILERSAAARVLVVRGAGRTFCGGRRTGKYTTAAEYRASVGSIFRVNRALRGFPGVTIAAVQGAALGFGAGLAIQCDIVLADADARFGFPEIRHGGAPGIIMSYLPSLVGPRRAFELLVTGREFSAQEAYAAGLVNRVVTDDLDAAVKETVESLLAVSDAAAVLKRAQQVMHPWPEEREAAVTELMVRRKFPE